jgi:hypothetical protein
MILVGDAVLMAMTGKSRAQPVGRMTARLTLISFGENSTKESTGFYAEKAAAVLAVDLPMMAMTRVTPV